jgi:hypothetical protein
MCRIVQDVGILRFITEILWDHKFLSDVNGCRGKLRCWIAQVPSFNRSKENDKNLVIDKSNGCRKGGK